MVERHTMITRIFADNYRCFERATLEPGALTLLLGPNGAGKSAVFEVLFKLRQLVVDGSPVASLFPDSTRTRWLGKSTQTFELGLRGPDGAAYTYRLAIRHERGQDSFIEREEILHENRVRYSFSGEEVKVWPWTGGVAFTFPAGSKVSPLSNLPSKYRSEGLSRVIDRLAHIWVFRPVPQTLDTVAREGKGGFLERDLSNFASWLLAMHDVRATFSRDLKRSLRIVLEGFRDYEFEQQGRGSHLLQFSFASPRRRGRVVFAFNELSEGQRALVVLYALLHAVSGEASTLCIDEPENFLSPREIQPWLNRLMDETEAGGQALLISHNPGLIDFLAPTQGLLLEREGGGPARVRPVPADGGGLPVSELLARGWVDG
ncbi:AAA family ATPase [Archangium minus]|uniref:AAA family ATPase n=2 Tax=Archangium minus TaxID=83450 RepID=A0ABY9WJL1_9BACT|nr:AAA family ATPase [Archangium minus]